MAIERNGKMKIPSLDELFSSQEERDDAKLKRIYEIPLDEIDSFPDHPFKVKDDEDMVNLVESVQKNGIITPATVRKKDDGRYELISGHRRKRACEIAGLGTLRAEIVEMNRNEAIIHMVESNFQRSTILPSEKGFAYKMRLEAIKRERRNERQRDKRAGTAEELEKIRDEKGRFIGYAPVGTPLGYTENKSVEQLSKLSQESSSQIQRYIRLTELIDGLRDKVDDGRIGLRTAVEMSYLPAKEQCVINEIIDREEAVPNFAQIRLLRRLHESNELDEDKIESVLMQEKPNQKEKTIIKSTRLTRLFPEDLPVKKREDFVIAAVEHYNAFLRQKKRNQDLER